LSGLLSEDPDGGDAPAQPVVDHAGSRRLGPGDSVRTAFYGVTPRGVVPPGLTPAHGGPACIDLAGGVDTTGGGGTLARHPGHQDCHQDGPECQSSHPSQLPGN